MQTNNSIMYSCWVDYYNIVDCGADRTRLSSTEKAPHSTKPSLASTERSVSSTARSVASTERTLTSTECAEASTDRTAASTERDLAEQLIKFASGSVAAGRVHRQASMDSQLYRTAGLDSQQQGQLGLLCDVASQRIEMESLSPGPK